MKTTRQLVDYILKEISTCEKSIRELESKKDVNLDDKIAVEYLRVLVKRFDNMLDFILEDDKYE